MFLVQVYAVIVLAFGATLWSYRRFRDSFHPLVYLSPMLGCLYGLLPLYLHVTDGLYGFLTRDEAAYVQWINVHGVLALLAGVVRGSGGQKIQPSGRMLRLPIWMWGRVRLAAVLIGLVGVTGFYYTIEAVGGLSEAYARAYGGGWSDLGLVRESVLFTLPALLWLMVVYRGRGPSWSGWFLISLFAAPLLLHGLLGARRGPIFIVVVALAMGWYLMRRRRPALLSVLLTGTALGLFLLFLVTNRSEIYLGSQFSYERSPLEYLQAGSGNEYIYGAGTMLDRAQTGQYFWGRRYLVVFFIRPIPRQIWPTKYEDATQFLGIPNIEGNMGLGTEELEATLGWAGARGAAPGIVADMWNEFWWFAIPVLFMIGWAYGRAWRAAVTHEGPWIPLYALMTALSLHLVMQTLEAMAFRLLLTALPSWLIWQYGMGIIRSRRGNAAVADTEAIRPRQQQLHPIGNRVDVFRA